MTKRPDIAKEWHPTKNETLTPYDVMEFSNKKVWWLCPNGHAYQYSIAHRTKDGRSCPICTGRQLCIGKNDLVTVDRAIAKEWNYELNGDLKPEQFTPISHKRVWWRCSNCGHEWIIMINNRYIHGNGCPKCAGKKKMDCPQKEKWRVNPIVRFMVASLFYGCILMRFSATQCTKREPYQKLRYNSFNRRSPFGNLRLNLF